MINTSPFRWYSFPLWYSFGSLRNMIQSSTFQLDGPILVRLFVLVWHWNWKVTKIIRGKKEGQGYFIYIFDRWWISRHNELEYQWIERKPNQIKRIASGVSINNDRKYWAAQWQLVGKYPTKSMERVRERDRERKCKDILNVQWRWKLLVKPVCSSLFGRVKRNLRKFPSLKTKTRHRAT